MKNNQETNCNNRKVLRNEYSFEQFSSVKKMSEMCKN